MWDVLVVGSGPAGSTAAIAALRAWPQARVGLVDRAEFPRDKSCGDGVAPHVLDVLGRLGVHGLLDDWTGVHRLRLRFPDGPELAGTMRRPAFVVPRMVLDARLRAVAIERGAQPVLHRVRRIEVERDRVLVDGSIETAVLIGADGAHSVVRSSIAAGPDGGRGTGPRAIAVRGYAAIDGLPPDEQLIVFGRTGGVPAYAWSFPIGDGRANVGYGEMLPPSGQSPTRDLLVRRLHELLPGELVGLTALRGHHLPLSTAGVRQPDGRVLLTGDALSMVNPLTGEGIHAAVLSGALAGIAAARAARQARTSSADSGALNPGARYRTALRGAYGRHTRDADLLARLARPRAVAAGLRGAARLSDVRRQQVFDDLVEFGLADGPITPRILGVIGQEMLRKSWTAARRPAAGRGVA